MLAAMSTPRRRRRALIVGVTGQDGSYLAELLLGKGYGVYGLVRPTSHDSSERIAHLLHRITLISGDLADESSLDRAILDVRPDEVYNLAAQSFVPQSWDHPAFTGDVTGLGVARLLGAVLRVKPDTRFYQASSSEMFGLAAETPQRETTPFHPRSPYGAAKVYGHHVTVNYRESRGLFAVSGICFNHESPRRGLEFVTRKITRRVAEIKLGAADELTLGNLDARRDWGFAGDYVDAMWRMLQRGEPEDFVIATGKDHSVREFVEEAFAVADLDWKKHVRVDRSLVRPVEANPLRGDASKAARKLGWRPTVSFKDLVRMMVKADLESARGERPSIAK
jgi:GDPmannose 4,6-dehydratase